MQTFLHSFGFTPEKNPLKGGGNFVFATRTPGTPGTPTGGATSGTGTPTTPTTRRVELTEEQLNEQRNLAHSHKLDSLGARGVLNAETIKEAKTLLRSPTAEFQAVARMLAAEEIGQDAFEMARDALKRNKSTPKQLARRLLKHTILEDTFIDAFTDLEGRDRYLKPLAQQLASGRIKELDFNRARHSMYDPSPVPPGRDERHAAQQLALGSIDAADYRTRVGMMTPAEPLRPEHQQDPVGNVRDDIHAKIAHLLEEVGIMIDALPERERTRPIKQLQQSLENLNQRDRANRDSMTATLRRLQESTNPAENITDDEMATILDFDVDKIPDDLDRLENDILTPMNKFTPAEIANIRTLKEEEYHIEKDFISRAKAAEEVMKVAVNFMTAETLKEFMRQEASKHTGINLQAGTQIQYVHPDPVHGNLATVSIQKVEFVEQPVLDRDDNVMSTQPANITIYLSDGQRLPLGRFMKWVNALDAYETVADVRDLETKLRLAEVQMELKSGQTVEYTKSLEPPDKNGTIKPNRDTVRIEQITNDRVVLSEPVITLRAEENPHLLTTDRQAREMPLGEFLKWSRRKDMVPEIPTLALLREYLGHHNKVNNTAKGRDPALYPPLPVQSGDILVKHGGKGDTKNNPYKIDKATDNGIDFADGTHMSLPQFFGWVRDNDVVSGNPGDLANREGAAARNLGEPPKPPSDASDNTKKGWWHNFLEGIKFDAKNPFALEKDRPYGPIEEMWQEYMFLSIKDLIGLGKAIIELMKRKHQARSKMRYSNLGKYLPPRSVGTEMERINQQAETEEMNQYKEAMSQWGTWQVLGKLHDTNSRFEAKACFIVLMEKGELRWDDMKMWECLNRLTSSQTTQGAALYIKLTHEPQIDPKTGHLVNGEDRTKEAIDALYGEGQWAEWFSKNISAYNNAKNAYEFKGKQLEADPKGTGGLRGELSRLLSDWKQGKYVNPMEYEELIDFAIKYGKLTGEEKMFYLMEGLTAKCSDGAMQGMTLLHLDRIGDLDGKYLNQFPLLDFFTNRGKKPFHPRYMSGEISLEDTDHGYTVEDLEMLRDEFFKEESDRCAFVPGKDTKFGQFLWEWMLVDPNFQVRLSKGLRRAEAMDHDDAHMYIPTATMEQIETFTGAYTGNQKYFTDEGYKNAYAGFNQYIVSLSNRCEDLAERQKRGLIIDDETIKTTEGQVLQAVQSYFMFDSILDGRRDRKSDSKARIGDTQYDKPCVVDWAGGDATVRDHKNQLDSLVKEICRAYGINYEALGLYEKTGYNNTHRQETIKGNMEQFLKIDLPNAIKNDPQGNKKMLDIILKRKYAAKSNPKSKDVLSGIQGANRHIINK